MPVSMIGPKFYCWDKDGKPLAGGLVYTYQARTNIPKPTYMSEDGLVANSNPVELNSAGYADIYLDGAYKIVVKDKSGKEIWTEDPVTAQGQTTSEWLPAQSVTFVDADTFTVAGNQTELFTAGRGLRLKGDNYLYAQVVDATYSGGNTHVNVVGDTLTADLATVSLSVITNESRYGRYSDTVYFATLAELLLQKNLKLGQSVGTVNRDSSGDGGGNVYKVVATGTGTHDGGSYIDHGASGVQLQAQFPGGCVFIEQFGCKVDGVTDDSAAFQAAVDFASARLASAKGGSCNLGTATITFLKKGRKIGNDKGGFTFEAQNLNITGQATIVLDSCKDVEIVGLTALDTDIDLRGVWRSTVRNSKLRRLLMCTTTGVEFSDNYWNNFYNSSFQQVVFPSGRRLNNANCFFGGIVRPKASLSYAQAWDHSIVIENPTTGSGAIEGMAFNGVDMEGGLVGFFDIDATWAGSIDQGYFLFDQCYFDSLPPEPSDQILIEVRLSQAQRQYPAPTVAAASLSRWDSREYFRSASIAPASALNKVVNGALKYESNKLLNAAPASMTWNSSAAGLYGRTVTINNTGLTYFNHDDARQAGFYSVMLVMRAAGTSRVKVDFAGVSSSVDLDSEFRVFTLYTHVKQAEGANINFTLSPHPQETHFDVELAYVSMQYGREINLGSAPSPGADIYAQSFAQGGVFSSGGADGLPTGWTSAKISTGVYEVTHNLNLTIRPIVTAMDGGARIASVDLANTDTSKFRVRVYDTAGTLTDTRFEFLARTSKAN